MSKTLRTKSDAIKYLVGIGHLACDRIEHLETELAEARAEIERKDKLIGQMREALKLLLEGAIHDFHYACQRRDNCLCWGCQKARVKVALSAAERGE